MFSTISSFSCSNTIIFPTERGCWNDLYGSLGCWSAAINSKSQQFRARIRQYSRPRTDGKSQNLPLCQTSIRSVSVEPNIRKFENFQFENTTFSCSITMGLPTESRCLNDVYGSLVWYSASINPKTQQFRARLRWYSRPRTDGISESTLVSHNHQVRVRGPNNRNFNLRFSYRWTYLQG